MLVTVLVTLLFIGLAAIALTLILITSTKQKRLFMVPRNHSDSQNLVSFFALAAYNKQKGRKRFLRMPLRTSGKDSIVSILPNIAFLDGLSELAPNHVEIDRALTKPSAYQWRDMQSFARKTMEPLLIGIKKTKSSSSEVVICLNLYNELPHFEFFRVAISKCARHVKKILIIVYDSLSRDKDVTNGRSLASALVKYLREFDCSVATGATKSNFNLIRNSANIVVLPHDAFGLMAAISGYNLNVVKLATTREKNIAWPINFLLLRNFALVDRNTCENKEIWIKRLTASCISPLVPKEPTFMEKIVTQMGKDVDAVRLQRHSMAPIYN